MGPGQPNKPFTSFFIRDILKKPNSYKRTVSARPPNHGQCCLSPFLSASSTVSSSLSTSRRQARLGTESETKSTTPLDALFKMTSKTFEGLDNRNLINVADATKREHFHIFGSKTQPAKKRRKSRTAFTNQQIYELEKRFLYQKYLTPADRDEIAQSLSLTNAQVITWFQNRRAKLKRDLEELKADVSHTSLVSSDEDDADDEPDSSPTTAIGFTAKKCDPNRNSACSIHVETDPDDVTNDMDIINSSTETEDQLRNDELK
ncbi:transcription factor LBX2-like [Tubulanus polymorphus]|uniref:transcription factor LBX2-like n=1 Tax=Tubulanus polymorphus TaxID=672921 RepID=UPI003DA44608